MALCILRYGIHRCDMCALAYADPWPDLTVLPGPCVAEAGVTRLVGAHPGWGPP
jgi:hypothetical protein